MFTNATLYRITASPAADFDILGALEANQFAPCGPSQEVSHGWVPPRGEGEALCECINGHLIYKLMTETKTVPADLLDRELDARCKKVEAETGRRPGKKERRELKDEIKLGLLPAAFPKRTATLVWINPTAKLLVIDTASAKRADDVVMQLVMSQEGLAMQPISTNTTPSGAMASWLIKTSLPETMGIDRDCVLAATDESKAKVKYEKHDLDIPEVVEHIQRGMMPESLALTWLNRVSFTLTSDMNLKTIEILNVDVEDAEKADEFDAGVCIATAEITSLVSDLLEELGGEVIITQEAE